MAHVHKHRKQLLTRVRRIGGQVAALEQALASAKSEAHLVFDASAFARVKAERDALRRAIKTGTIWDNSSTS